uniref:Uncharacterized protein n=1 Tax=Clastoptera arizonana TaxID=38151 RepID=A0A1B6DBF1_9HEMI
MFSTFFKGSFSVYLLSIYVPIYVKCFRSYNNPPVFQTAYGNASDVEKVVAFGVYYNYEDVKKAFDTEDAKDQHVLTLFQEYEKNCPNHGVVTNPRKKHPFIVVEGVHRTTRSIVGHKIASRIQGIVLSNPPKYMTSLSERLPSGNLFRKAFFTLGIYGSSCEARDKVEDSPILVNGHWMFQSTFAMAKIFGCLPPLTSPVYDWPKDLFKPDVVVFINPPIPPHLKQRTNYFTPVLVEMYRKWKDPPVIEVNSSSHYDEIATLSVELINRKLGTNYIPMAMTEY